MSDKPRSTIARFGDILFGVLFACVMFPIYGLICAWASVRDRFLKLTKWPEPCATTIPVHGYIGGDQERENINRAMAVVVELRSEDGRVFRVRSWEPHVERGSAVTVKINAIVLIPKSSTAQP